MLNLTINHKQIGKLRGRYKLGKKKILLVDSCPIIAKKMSELITDLKQTSLGCVQDIHTLERRITSCSPDLIIINIATKGEFDGYQIAKILKLDYEVPFCILFDEKSNGLRKWAEELNPDSFISYSTSERELINQLEQALY